MEVGLSFLQAKDISPSFDRISVRMAESHPDKCHGQCVRPCSTQLRRPCLEIMGDLRFSAVKRITVQARIDQ